MIDPWERTLRQPRLVTGFSIARAQIRGLLRAAMRFPVTLISAPAGFGKTIALDEALKAFDSLVVRYELDPSIDALGPFARGLAHALGTVRPSARLSFAGAYERAAESTETELKLARWLAEHLKGLEATIVVDQLHHLKEHERAGKFLTYLAEATGEKIHWIYAARGDFGLPVPRWMAEQRMGATIDADALQFSLEDAQNAAIRLGLSTPPERVRAIVTETEGWPIGVLFGLQFSTISSFEILSKRILDERSECERQFLLETCLLPYLNEEVCAAVGWRDAARVVEGMAHVAPFIFVRSGALVSYHDHFAEYLESKLKETSAFEATAHKTVAALDATGATREALQCARRYALRDEIVRQLDSHGLQMLERGNADVVKSSLDAFDLRERECTGITLAIKALFESRAGRTDTSEAWFRLAMERVRDPITKAEIAYLYGRDLQQRRRPDSIDILLPHASDESLPLNLRVSILSSLAQGYVHNNELDLADSFAGMALEAGGALRDASAVARLHVRAGYVALYSGNRIRARTLGLRAARLGERSGDFHTACGAYSILYAIAADDDMPAVCLRYVRRIGENGAKCADPRWQLYALIAAYELEAERGCLADIADVRRDLKAFDIHYSTLDAMEGLLPSRALECAWQRNFTEAHRLLAPSASQQIEADRRGLRWAEVALYAAAARLKRKAIAALRSSREALKAATPSIRTHRATIYCVLALRLIGRRHASALLLHSLGPDPSKRLSALRDAIAQVCRRLDGTSKLDELAHSMNTLAQNHSEGLARMLLAISDAPISNRLGRPTRVARVLDADRDEFVVRLLEASNPIEDRTIGSTLSAYQLTERLLAYLEDNKVTEFANWLESFLDQHAESDEVRRMASHIPDSLTEFFTARAPKQTGYRQSLTPLDGVIRWATLRPRRKALFPEDEILDEIDVAINALIFRLDQANPLTAEHSQAVASWCTRLARRIGLSETETVFASRCGLIHDIGKVTTPTSILNAPRGLDEGEWKIMRDHTVAGERIIREAPLLIPFASAVRSHHERLDGKGYPDGVRGHSIPFMARLVAVADCFNAMIGRRPYRKPMSPPTALNELEQHLGSHFDPEIVRAMVEVVSGK